MSEAGLAMVVLEDDCIFASRELLVCKLIEITPNAFRRIESLGLVLYAHKLIVYSFGMLDAAVFRGPGNLIPELLPLNVS
jgi:hypothetical protein